MLGPIFNRELLTLPRRGSHYLNRAAYLGVLWILGVTAWQATVGWEQTVTLYETGRFGPLVFRLTVVVQLVLLLFFAALTAAGAITQEKDRRTFVLLLLTDLKNHEIVLGKLFGSLLQIALFLAGSVPLLLLLTLLGGIAPYQVGQAVLVLAATALAAGALGNLVALWREKTFQALALTVLFIVLYMCIVQGLPPLVEWITGKPSPAMDYAQQCLDPFRALVSVQQPPHPDDPAIPAAYGYALAMLGISVLLAGWGMYKLRVWNPSGEPIMQRENVEDQEAEDKADRSRIHAAPGAVRTVGDNPIYWRETATRAYGRKPLLVKLAYFIVVGLVCYYALAPLFGPAKPSAFAAAWGLAPVAILSLLLIAAQSATAITSERDIGALDLLLVTDLTPKEFIYGKLGGILYNTKEFILPPLFLAGVYAAMGLLATPPAGYGSELRPAMNFEAGICLIIGGLILIAFTLMLGLHVSLRTLSSRLATLNTLSTVFFLSVGTLICVYLILINPRFEAQWTSFLVFTIAGVGGLMWVLNGTRPSTALVLASWFCPFAVLYTVINVIVGKPGTPESADPIMPLLVVGGAFGFAIVAMLVPLISEFDVALGRTTAGGE